jgi:hypothetical protein
MYLTMSAQSINLSVSMLFRILHILSILAGPCATVSTQKQVQKVAGTSVIHYARKEKIAARYRSWLIRQLQTKVHLQANTQLPLSVTNEDVLYLFT